MRQRHFPQLAHGKRWDFRVGTQFSISETEPAFSSSSSIIAREFGTGCRLTLSDFHQDGDEATISLHAKGDKHRRIGLHFAAAEAIGEYITKAGLSAGPLFRARRNSRLKVLSDQPRCLVTMYNLVQVYLPRLPGAFRENEIPAKDCNTCLAVGCRCSGCDLGNRADASCSLPRCCWNGSGTRAQSRDVQNDGAYVICEQSAWRYLTLQSRNRKAES
jgi:hypothetical protein